MPYDMDPAQSGPLRSASARSQSWFVAIAVIYLLSLELSYFFPDSRQALMVVWPAAGIGLGAFLLCPQSQWPRLAVLLFLTGNLANVIEQRPLLASIGFMTANVLESMGCAALFLWFGAFRVSFAHVREVILLLVGAVCVNAVTALLGATVAYVVTGAGLVEAWKTWWIADGLGILVVTPCFVACIHCIGRGLHESKIRMAEYAGFLVVWLALGWTTFHLSPLSSFFSPPAYILVAMLAWPAFRFGVLGTSVALVLLAVLTITGTQLTFETEFAHTSLNLRRLMEAQEFVAVVTIAGLLLSASHAEARSFAKNAVNEQARLRSLGDNLHNGVIYQEVRELDGTMRFLHVSAGLMRMNGISPEAALRDASAMYTLVLPEDRARLAIAEDASLQSMSVLDIAIRIRRPDGEVRWMQVTSTPRRLRDGRILWDGIQVDITEQKQLETEVLVSKERLQDVLENSLTASYKRNLITDSYDYLSPVAAQLTGYPLEELNGLSYTQILERVHPDDRPSISDAVVSALAGTGQSEHQLEFRMLHKLGEYRWFHDQFTILRDCDGVPTALIGSIGDITDRNCLESALQMSEANLKAIFNASDDSIF